MSAQSPELISQIAEWRAKQAAGTLTTEELRQAVAVMRANRVALSYAPKGAPSRKKPAAVLPSADDMLDELGI